METKTKIIYALICVIVILLAVNVFRGTLLGNNTEVPDGTRIELVNNEAPVDQQSVPESVQKGNAESALDVVLDLRDKGLTNVPMNTFTRVDAEVLDLSNNKLTGALQAEVRHMQNLRVLDLSDNEFTGVPAEIGQLSHLETLDLSNNQLTGLPHELGNLKSLQTLDLRGNQISQADLDVIRKGLSSSVEILLSK